MRVLWLPRGVLPLLRLLLGGRGLLYHLPAGQARDAVNALPSGNDPVARA